MANLEQAMNLQQLYNSRNINIEEFNQRTNQHSLSFDQYNYKKNLTLCLTPSNEPISEQYEDCCEDKDSKVNYYPNSLEVNKIIKPDQFKQVCNNPYYKKGQKHYNNIQRETFKKCNPCNTYNKYVEHKQQPNEDTFIVNLVEPLIIESISTIEIENISIYTDSKNALKKDLILIGIKEFNIKNNTNDPNLKGKIVISNVLKDKFQGINVNTPNYHSMITDNGPAKYGYVSSIPPGKYSQLNITVSSYDLNLCYQQTVCQECSNQQLNPSPIFKDDNACSKNKEGGCNTCNTCGKPKNNEDDEDNDNECRPRIILSYIIIQNIPFIPKNIFHQTPIQSTSLPQSNMSYTNYSSL
jgi:hypothetical protein